MLLISIQIIPKNICFFFSSPGHRPCELLSWVSVRRPSVSFSHCHLESWPPKDHSWHVCFKLTYWFQRKRLLNIFSIVKTKSSHDGLLDISDRQTIHKFSTGPPNDHSCKVTIQLALWFLTRVNLKQTCHEWSLGGQLSRWPPSADIVLT
jgi:hypothetical protein